MFPGGVELFVIDGAIHDDLGRYAGGTWLRLPAGSTFNVVSENGCVAYVKTGALASLRSV
jgi:hypothetical protein